jgi:hypothetical protein
MMHDHDPLRTKIIGLVAEYVSPEYLKTNHMVEREVRRWMMKTQAEVHEYMGEVAKAGGEARYLDVCVMLRLATLMGLQLPPAKG